ncbi:MAG: hypothetical protein WBN48_06090, partial [Thiogranum sp.]
MQTISKVPRETRWSVFYLLAALAVLAALVTAPQAQARSGYLSEWRSLYPASTTDATSGRNGCQVCHAASNGDMNAYGDVIRADFDSGIAIGIAITNAEGQDS